MSDSNHERPGLFRRLWHGSDKVKTARYALNTYGKLPIYKDFISTGLTEPAARDFRNWLDRGFSHRWSVDEDYRQTEIPSHSFLFRLPDGKGCVAGSLWGSSDQGGLRKFPFTLFFSFPEYQPVADPLTATDYLSHLEKRCEDLRERFGPGASLASLHQAYRGAEFECPVRTREQILREAKSAASQVTLSEFADSLLGDSSAARWPAMLESLAEVQARSEGIGAIRLPLGGSLPRAREIEFWLLWWARRDARKRLPVCGLLYPNGTGPGRFVLFLRDLRPEDILLLHPARGDYPDVLELPKPETRVEPVTPPVALATETVPGSSDEVTEPEAVQTPEPPVALTSESATPEPLPIVPVEPATPPVALAAETVPGPGDEAIEQGAVPTPEASGALMSESPDLEPEPIVSVEPATVAGPEAAEPVAISEIAAAEPDPVAPVSAETIPAPAEAPPVESALGLQADVAPFPDAETVPPGPSHFTPDDPLLDSSGRLRETQPPFQAGPGRLTGSEVASVATPTVDPDTELPAPGPKETAVEIAPETPPSEVPEQALSAGSAEAPVPSAPAVADGASSPPAQADDTEAASPAAVVVPPVTVAPAATARPAPPKPPGWDRPLFSLLEG